MTNAQARTHLVAAQRKAKAQWFAEHVFLYGAAFAAAVTCFLVAMGVTIEMLPAPLVHGWQ